VQNASVIGGKDEGKCIFFFKGIEKEGEERGIAESAAGDGVRALKVMEVGGVGPE
jgi:hypothetical protein